MRRGKARHAAELDFELNIAPIIDCFTVLITYLLISASFVSLGFLDVFVSTPSPADKAMVDEPKVSLAIELLKSGEVQLTLAGAEQKVVNLPSKEGQWDLQALTEKLEPIKARWSELERAVISADQDVEYGQVVKAVEVTRKLIPAALLGDRPVRE